MALNRVLPITREPGEIIVVVDRVFPERISRSLADKDDKRGDRLYLHVRSLARDLAVFRRNTETRRQNEERSHRRPVQVLKMLLKGFPCPLRRESEDRCNIDVYYKDGRGRGLQ